jgi:hypothetical protein
MREEYHVSGTYIGVNLSTTQLKVAMCMAGRAVQLPDCTALGLSQDKIAAS